MEFTFNGFYTLISAVIVLLLGRLLVNKIDFLRRYNIPEPVAGGLVAAVVLMTRMPRSPQEWGVGLICTVVSSLAGGSFIIVKWGLHEWVTDVWGMIALGGFFFVCGLPGWALVRWIFNFIDKQEGKTIVEVIKEFKKARKDIENS